MCTTQRISYFIIDTPAAQYLFSLVTIYRLMIYAAVISTYLGKNMLKVNWIASHSGVLMHNIIYGTAWKKERTRELVINAVQAGFRGIDTAGQPRHYNEPMVGEALQVIKQRGVERESLYLQTKYTPVSSQDRQSLPYDPISPVAVQVKQSFEHSLKNLQTSYVDGFILHSPLENHQQSMQAWSAMEDIFKAGQARQLGISNCYNLAEMKAIYNDAEVKPAIVQNRFYRETHYDKKLRHWCNENNIIFQSFWSLTANKDLLGSVAIKRLAESYRKTTAQIFFRFLIQSNILPLTGTSSDLHMREDIENFDYCLTGEELESINILLD